jgi:hypothetical protein
VLVHDLIDGLHLTAEWFPFLDRSELAKLELSVDRNVLGGPPRVWNGAIKLKDLIPEAGAE